MKGISARPILQSTRDVGSITQTVPLDSEVNALRFSPQGIPH